MGRRRQNSTSGHSDLSLLEKLLRRIHPNSANLFLGRSPLSEISNGPQSGTTDAVGGVHTNTIEAVPPGTIAGTVSSGTVRLATNLPRGAAPSGLSTGRYYCCFVAAPPAAGAVEGESLWVDCFWAFAQSVPYCGGVVPAGRPPICCLCQAAAA
jgi:hypothetical protein